MNNKIKYEIKYLDCHSHPHDEKFGNVGIDMEKVLEEFELDGGGTIAIGTDYLNSEKAIKLAQNYENIWATIGIHPADNHAEIFDEQKFEELLELGNKNNLQKVVGIGECGLDYYYFDKFVGDLEQEKNRQKELFVKQIKFAIKNNLPLVLHGRPSKNSMDAYRDMLDILEQTTLSSAFADATPSKEGEFSAKLRGHCHFFVGNLEIAKRFLDINFLISFDGPITFTTEYDAVIKYIPIENILIETDSPYAAPKSHRGQINFPIYVKEIARKIAELKNLNEEEVLKQTLDNAKKLFKLDF